ncbi:hypothetical protein Hanom_Chr01g00071421 [Helianthus anomalus]
MVNSLYTLSLPSFIGEIYSLSFCFISDVGQKNEGCKPYRASSRAHEPSQIKLELGSFTNRAEPSWLVKNRANFEPSFL